MRESCTKKSSKQFAKEIEIGRDGYPLYRRRTAADREASCKMISKREPIIVESLWVVPYSLPLDRIFKTHINVKHCWVNWVSQWKKGNPNARMLKERIFIDWDESIMSHKGALEALNATLQGLHDNRRLMGGLTVLLSDDFGQTLPVVPRDTRRWSKASMKSCLLYTSRCV